MSAAGGGRAGRRVRSLGGGTAAKYGLAIKESGLRGDQRRKPDRFQL